ncbi:ATP-binding cassette sub-family B member 10, mitochondrial-like [Bolinopsis microptera]|uniref:ATP-binding cassette sub-family B member 10, mitochondrial-like n=1 Tax=Bolinopsis microptera TaxID=2820187 RepID=UPI003079FAAA
MLNRLKVISSINHITKKRIWIPRTLIAMNSDTDKMSLKPKPKNRSLKRLLSLLAPEKFSCLAAVSLLGVSTAVTLSVPLCVQHTVDAIFKTSTTESSSLLQNLDFEQVCLGFAGLFAIGALANTGRIWFIQSASCRVVRDLRLNVLSSLMRNDMPYFDNTTSGELVNRLSADCQLVGDVLTQNVSDILRSFGQSIVSIGLMVYVAPDLALRASLIVPSIMIVAYFAGKIVRRISKELQDNLALSTARAEEGFSGIKVVKAFGAEEKEIGLYGNHLNKILSLGYKSAAVNSLYWSFLGGSGNFALLVVLYSGYQLSLSGSISPGTLTGFLLYTVYSGIGVAGLGKAYGALMAGAGAGQRLFEIIDTAPPQDLRQPIPHECFAKDIQLSNVKFRYPSRPDEVILNDFSEVFQKGQVTALVGSSGCGKSTVTWLLAGLYHCENGAITIGGFNIRDIPSKQLANHVSIVSQEPPLFTASIHYNIAYGCQDDLTEDQVIKAAEIAEVLPFVAEFEHGIHSEVGNKGSSLSGGQKQRIAIARAIVRNPDILILDEATSALDSATEGKVLKNIEDNIDCTTIVIAHRLSTIIKADKIIVMDKGVVKEVGNYNSLVNAGGMFSELVKLQEKSLDS